MKTYPLKDIVYSQELGLVEFSNMYKYAHRSLTMSIHRGWTGYVRKDGIVIQGTKKKILLRANREPLNITKPKVKIKTPIPVKTSTSPDWMFL